MRISPFSSAALYACAALHSYGEDKTQTVQGRAQLEQIYEEACALLRGCNSEFHDSAVKGSPPLKMSAGSRPFERPSYRIFGSFLLGVQADSGKIAYLNYFSLLNRLTAKGQPRTHPGILPSDALDRARGYLEQWKFPATDGLGVTEISYDHDYPGCWLVRWTRFAGGYPWDDFNSALLESIYVVFHETIGLVALGDGRFSPPPADTHVGISREDAIQRASPCVSLVQKTSFYRQARRAGFVADRLKSCELRVAIPNWLLDPKKAIWLLSAPPEETRLCWIVRFTTVDEKYAERGLGETNGKPIELGCPDILIYIDAATGEVVGANFT